MTKDLAICIKGNINAVTRRDYQETFEFINTLAKNLEGALAKNAVAAK